MGIPLDSIATLSNFSVVCMHHLNTMGSVHCSEFLISTAIIGYNNILSLMLALLKT